MHDVRRFGARTLDSWDQSFLTWNRSTRELSRCTSRVHAMVSEGRARLTYRSILVWRSHRKYYRPANNRCAFVDSRMEGSFFSPGIAWVHVACALACDLPVSAGLSWDFTYRNTAA